MILKKTDFKNEYTCTIIGLFTNAFLTVLKLSVGIIGQSHALIADSIHSLSDGFATFITYIAIKISNKPADEDHPYGHGNIETIASWFVAVLLLLTGIYLGYSAIHAIYHKNYFIPHMITMWIALLSAISKEILYRYTIFVGKLVNSPAIKANALDHRSDAFSSIGALIGIIAARFGYPFLDPLAGIIISAMIIKMGLHIFRESTNINYSVKGSM
ncbi:cation diffusion facilitator family transporter, partial [Elusimicrobiota bacterium]